MTRWFIEVYREADNTYRRKHQECADKEEAMQAAMLFARQHRGRITICRPSKQQDPKS